MYLEHTLVELVRDFPAHGLAAGDVGTVVGSYGNVGYEVEFISGGRTVAVVTLAEPDIRLARGVDEPSELLGSCITRRFQGAELTEDPPELRGKSAQPAPLDD